MQRTSKLYFILTYLSFIYPPFIWGLVIIYNVRNGMEDHVLSLIVNIILLAIITGIVWLLSNAKKLHLPNKVEQRYLLFGLFGNIVVYLYTFQNALNIRDIVTIYLVLLLVLFMYYLLIKRVFKPLELWILLPIFFLIDILHLLLTGCGYDDWSCDVSQNNEPLLITLYFIMIITVVLMYTYKILLLKTYDVLKYVHLGLLVLIAILFQNTDNLQYKFTQTILILFLFLVVLDFIVRIVNKTYTVKMLLFYIRTLTLLFVFMILGTMEFFLNPDIEGELLTIMVGVTYVSLFTNILKSQFKVDIPDQNPLLLFRYDTPKIVVHKCTDQETTKLTSLSNQKATIFTDNLGNILGYLVYEIEEIGSLKSLIINDIKLEQNDIISNIFIELDKTSHEYKAVQVIIKTHQLSSNEILLERGYLPIKTNTSEWFVKHQKRL